MGFVSNGFRTDCVLGGASSSACGVLYTSPTSRLDFAASLRCDGAVPAASSPRPRRNGVTLPRRVRPCLARGGSIYPCSFDLAPEGRAGRPPHPLVVDRPARPLADVLGRVPPWAGTLAAPGLGRRAPTARGKKGACVGDQVVVVGRYSGKVVLRGLIKWGMVLSDRLGRVGAG